MSLLHAVSASALLAAATIAQVYRPHEPVPGVVELKVLEAAKAHPAILWAFLTDPDTKFDEAIAAAQRCRDVFALELLEPLFRARHQLHRERELHLFGLRQPKEWSGGVTPRIGIEAGRRMLGRDWTLPAERSPYPRSWEDARAAPWPWRVCEVLERTLEAIHPISSEAEQPRTRAWFAECLRWRIDDEAGAQVFVDATSCTPHAKSMGVLARWRRILLDPATPMAAARVAGMLGEAHRLLLWGEPDARLACQLIAADGLRNSTNDAVRQQCAHQLRSLSLLFVPDARNTEQKAPLPVEAVLAAGDLATATAASPTALWTTLYVFAFSVCEVVAAPPFPAKRSMQWNSAEVPRLQEQFAEWWRTQKPAFEALGQERADAATRVRAELDRLMQ